MKDTELFGIEPRTINVRKAKYTIGKTINSHWNDKKHSEKGTKYFDEDTRKWMCKD